MIEIGALEAGDVVEYSIEKHGFTYALLDGMPSDDERFIPPMRGQFYDIVPFWISEPTMVKNYTISVPQSKHVQYEFYQGTCSPSVRFADGRQILSFTVEDARPFDREPQHGRPIRCGAETDALVDRLSGATSRSGSTA